MYGVPVVYQVLSQHGICTGNDTCRQAASSYRYVNDDIKYQHRQVRVPGTTWYQRTCTWYLVPGTSTTVTTALDGADNY